MLKSTLHNWRCFIDLLWTFLCGHQPLPPPPHLHREHHRQIQRKEKDGDAPSLVLNRRQRLPVHGARYSALPSIILNVKMEQRCISFFLKTCDNKNNATALRNVRFIVTEFLSIVCFFNRILFIVFRSWKPVYAYHVSMRSNVSISPNRFLISKNSGRRASSRIVKLA